MLVFLTCSILPSKTSNILLWCRFLERALYIFPVLFSQESFFHDNGHSRHSFVSLSTFYCSLRFIQHILPLYNFFLTEPVLEKCIWEVHVLVNVLIVSEFWIVTWTNEQTKYQLTKSKREKILSGNITWQWANEETSLDNNQRISVSQQQLAAPKPSFTVIVKKKPLYSATGVLS